MSQIIISVFGAGVAGLTVAHQLSKLDYEVHVYEKKNKVGGMARSGRDGDGCATEYCWRVFFGFYANLLPILGEIPRIGSKGTVLDDMTEYGCELVGESTSTKDNLNIGLNIARGLTSCDERLNDLDDLSWWDSMKNVKGSNATKEIGEWLGMDRYKGSYNSVIRVGMEQQMVPSYLDPNYRDYVTTKPTSEAVFDPWVKYLKGKGVIFHMDTELVGLDIISGNKIASATVKDMSGNYRDIISDEYVLSLPIEEVAKYSYIKSLNNTPKLRDLCGQMQLSFQVYFDRPIRLAKDNSYLLVGSPWDIIILSYDTIYNNTKLCNNIKKAKGGWSVAACTAYIPGIVYNKPMNECTYEEIIHELWTQMTKNKLFQEVIYKANNFELTDDMVVKWSPMWPTFHSSDTGKLYTSEPKFTNNTGSLKLRPSYKTSINNLYLATGYVKETIDIFSMEAACIAGKQVAHSINNESTKPIILPRPYIFAPLRAIDKISYALDLPNISIPLILLFVGIMIKFILS